MVNHNPSAARNAKVALKRDKAAKLAAARERAAKARAEGAKARAEKAKGGATKQTKVSADKLTRMTRQSKLGLK